jgi:hypothetical protein
MSAELLREAAALMRARAEACLASDDQWYEPAEMLEMLRSKDSDAFAQPHDAEHIASWHPAVALAVADWLDGIAEAMTRPSGGPSTTREEGAALAVARVYLGTTA